MPGEGGGGGCGGPVDRFLPVFMPCMDPNCRLKEIIVVAKMCVYLGLAD